MQREWMGRACAQGGKEKGEGGGMQPAAVQHAAGDTNVGNDTTGLMVYGWL